MQCKTIDLISAHKLLQNAAQDIAQLRKSFDAALKKASSAFLHALTSDVFLRLPFS